MIVILRFLRVIFSNALRRLVVFLICGILSFVCIISFTRSRSLRFSASFGCESVKFLVVKSRVFNSAIARVSFIISVAVVLLVGVSFNG